MLRQASWRVCDVHCAVGPGCTRIPLALTITGGNRHDITQLIPLLDAVPPVRGKPGRPRRQPAALFGDRGYDFDSHRRVLRRRRIRPVIGRRGTSHGSGLGTVRWVVERTFAADMHEALVKLACCLICWRCLERSF